MQELFSILPQVDSTNNYAMAAIRNGEARDGSCWFAKHQTGGKGQRGKTWINNPDENIAMTIALKPKPYFTHNLFILNALVAVIVRRFCEEVTGKNGFYIKWPNDLYFADKKTAGILIETIFSKTFVTDCVIGLGLNINQLSFGSDLPNATSLKIISGIQFQPIDLARRLHKKLLEYIEVAVPEEVIKEYNLYLYKKGAEVKLRRNNISFRTKIHSVTEFGQLVTLDSIERKFNFGEISWEISP